MFFGENGPPRSFLGLNLECFGGSVDFVGFPKKMENGQKKDCFELFT